MAATGTATVMTGRTDGEVRPARLRAAELTSGVGARVLGVGFGGLAAERLGGLSVPLVPVGVLAHNWGMFDKRRPDR